MLFNSITFLFFFPIVTALYFLLPFRYRWSLLLFASCFFYMFFKPEYILILAFTIVIDYFAGLLLEKTEDVGKKRYYLILSLIANIGVLAIFKYYNFINDQVTGLALLFDIKNPIPYLTILLPIGLSFHTFQAMSYTIEVYRGNQKAEQHFGIYALYVMFYPQLVAGPIERPQNILHQFKVKHNFNYDNALLGLNLIIMGLFKKIVIADRLAIYVNQVYNDLEHASTISMALAAVFFTVQIYCDFSGYSDIARGTAKFMGFDLMVNFNLPLQSKSVTEFWRRWHISLSSWFNDYLFTPLVIAKRDWGIRGVVFALFITFTISGLWHGAGWNFILFGMLHAVAVILELLTKKQRKKLAKWTPSYIYNTISLVLTFTFVTVSFIFFRSVNLAQVSKVFERLTAFDFSINLNQISADKGPLNLLISLAAIVFLFPLHRLPANFQFKRNWYNVTFLTISIFLIIILGKDAANEFIYFQF